MALCKQEKEEGEKAKREAKNSKYGYLFDSESGVDVTFYVGPERTRFNLHSFVLITENEFFRAKLSGPLSRPYQSVHELPDDSPAGFHHFIRWLYKREFSITTVEVCLETLVVAIKYICPGLIRTCCHFISNHLDSNNVLLLVSVLYNFYVPLKPTAPPLNEMEPLEFSSSLEENQNSVNSYHEAVDTVPMCDLVSFDPTADVSELINKCLNVIDTNPKNIFESDLFVAIDKTILNLIIKRDSLNVRSELEVLWALNEWAKDECRRRGMSLSCHNRRFVLEDTFFQARLLTMRKEEIKDLKKDTDLCQLFTLEELQYFESRIKNKVQFTVPESLRNHIHLLSKTRHQQSIHYTGLPKSKKRFSKINKENILLDLISLLAILFD